MESSFSKNSFSLDQIIDLQLKLKKIYILSMLITQYYILKN